MENNRKKLSSEVLTAGGNNYPLSTIYYSLFFIISILLAAIFIKFPQIDIYVSGLFYIEGQKFYLKENSILMFLHNSVTYVTTFMAVLWISLIIATSIKKRPVFGLSRIRAIYLLLALIIGPGIVVNAIFKDQWGRARPSQIEMFGGKSEFTPAFIISDQCESNCSFVSGDPSVGFYLLALALAIPRYRKLFICASLSAGVVLSATRIIQGGHFLSDTIFSGIFTFTVIYLLYIALLKVEAKQQ